MYKCTCMGHFLELDFDEECEQVDFIFWTRDASGSISFKNRLKMIWQIIRYGEVLHDSCVLTYEDAVRLASEISERIPNLNKEYS